MAFMFHSRKVFSPLIIVAFIWLLFFVSWPLDASGRAEENLDRDAVMAGETIEGDGSGMVEKESAPRAAVKKKGFPWLLVLGGAVVVGAALYFFVLKKDKEELREDFDSALSDKWLTYHSGNWNVGGGTLNVTATAALDFETAVYDQAWSKTDFTTTVRMKRLVHYGAHGILLSTGSDMGSVNGYFFDLWGDGTYSVYRVNGYQYGPRTSAYSSSWSTTMKSWTSSGAILSGLDTWNVYKVVRTGNTYSFYANDTLLHTFTDATYDPRYVTVAMNPFDASGMAVDYVYVDVGVAAAASVPVAAAAQALAPAPFADPLTRR